MDRKSEQHSVQNTSSHNHEHQEINVEGLRRQSQVPGIMVSGNRLSSGSLASEHAEQGLPRDLPNISEEDAAKFRMFIQNEQFIKSFSELSNIYCLSFSIYL